MNFCDKRFLLSSYKNKEFTKYFTRWMKDFFDHNKFFFKNKGSNEKIK